MFNFLNIGTVTMFNKLNVGTVPMFNHFLKIF